jgi:DNA-directed RNA polymerase subunit RPC12/RpoP
MATPSHRCSTCGKTFSAESRNVDESPLPQDLIEEQCPHCGSTEIHRLYHRRLKVLTMFALLTVLVVPLSLFPKYVCDNCGRKS